jgi:predicted ATPase
LRQAQNLQTQELLQIAHLLMGAVLLYLGELPESRRHLEQAIGLYDTRVLNDPQMGLGSGPAGSVGCLVHTATALWVLGYPDQALGRIRESLARAEELSHPPSLAYALGFAATHSNLRTEVEATQEQAEALIALSHQQGFTYWEAVGVTFQAWALAKQGRQEEGIAQIRQSLSTMQAIGEEQFQPYVLALLAEVCGEAGQPEEGLTALTEAFDLVSKTQERWNEAERYRLQGELLLMQDELSAAQAESCFERAIEVGRQQSAKSWELRATMSLARLLRDTGRRAEAHAILAEIYNWFSEGFDTADLKEAKALLNELSR